MVLKPASKMDVVTSPSLSDQVQILLPDPNDSPVSENNGTDARVITLNNDVTNLSMTHTRTQPSESARQTHVTANGIIIYEPPSLYPVLPESEAPNLAGDSGVNVRDSKPSLAKSQKNNNTTNGVLRKLRKSSKVSAMEGQGCHVTSPTDLLNLFNVSHNSEMDAVSSATRKHQHNDINQSKASLDGCKNTPTPNGLHVSPNDAIDPDVLAGQKTATSETRLFESRLSPLPMPIGSVPIFTTPSSARQAHPPPPSPYPHPHPPHNHTHTHLPPHPPPPVESTFRAISSPSNQDINKKVTVLSPLHTPKEVRFPDEDHSLSTAAPRGSGNHTTSPVVNKSPVSVAGDEDLDLSKTAKPVTLAVVGSTTLTTRAALIKGSRSESSFDYTSKRGSVSSTSRPQSFLSIDAWKPEACARDMVPVKEEETTVCSLTSPSSSRGRQCHAVLILTISVVPLLALLIQNSITVYDDDSKLKQHLAVKDDISFSTETGDVMHQTQIERGMTALYVSSTGDPSVFSRLRDAQNKTDAKILQMTKWISQDEPSHFKSRDAYHQRIIQFRENSAKTPLPTVTEVIEFYSNDNSVMEGWVGQSIKLSQSGSLWTTMVSYFMLIISKEKAGIERALGSTFYAQGGLDGAQYIMYLESKLMGITYLQRSQEYSPAVSNLLDERFNNGEVHLNLMRVREEILQNNITSRDIVMGSDWFGNMTFFLNILWDIQNTLADDIVHELDEEVDRLTNVLVVSVVINVVAVILFPFVVMSVYRLTSRIQGYTNMLQERTQELDIERQRSQTLLYELLPQKVADKLLSHEAVSPTSYKAVTIFFSDIVGFTHIASRSTPMQVIDMLNSLYRIFDDIIESHDVYKVETIGDAYMVASGVPEENLETHAEEIAHVALDMRHNISNLMVNHLPNESLQIRIGLNSGPVVAGVVGHKMPRYCLFGDTVNVASRMESTSLPLKIQITQSTKEELEKRNRNFVITQRGQIDVKGKGSMTTYWLVKRLKDITST